MPYIQKVSFETFVKNWEPPKKEWKCTHQLINNPYRDLAHEMGEYYCDRGLCDQINQKSIHKLHSIKIKEFNGYRILNALVCDYCKDRIKVE